MWSVFCKISGQKHFSPTWANPLWALYIYIVACQRGGVSNKPTLGSGQRQDTESGITNSNIKYMPYELPIPVEN